MSTIAVLPPEEARKIAAGEVIDRPGALVREFVDNAIDARAARIDVMVEDGGARRVEVVDDGEGMEKDDLERCWLAHATSKIRSLDDLNTATSLGFRGEALAAAAAVSRLEILSSRDGREAWLLSVGPAGAPPSVEQSRRGKGSSVRAIGLFDSVPARKRFLKRAGSEAAACKQAMLEKALPFPAIEFRFTQDGALGSFFPRAETLKDRYAAVIPANEVSFLHEIAALGDGFSVSIVFGGPEIIRRDRRQQYVFANGRRIEDFGFLQALEYGLQGWFPNGTHPAGAVFITVDPALADFNIHPAKREARFRDGGAIHHAITTALRDFTRRGIHAAAARQARDGNSRDNNSVSNELDFAKGDGGAAARNDTERAEFYGDCAAFSPFAVLPAASGALAAEALLDATLSSSSDATLSSSGLSRGSTRESGPADMVAEQAPAYPAAKTPPPSPKTLRLAGRLFNLFILAEAADRVFVIDQHAAHERILYDRFLAGPVPRQELLAPIPFETESGGDDEFLAAKAEELSRLGIDIARDGEGGWLVEALPAGWRAGDAETVREILSLRGAGENIAERWAAALACHSAVRDGDTLDDGTALALAREALALPDPRCPHGRPVWTEITREALFRAVKRS